MTFSRITGRIVLVVSLPFIAATQPLQKQKDAQSKFEPRSDPGAGQKLLQQFVGEWDVVKTLHPTNGEPVETRGTCRQTMLHDGRFLQSVFVFNTGGGATGLGLIGFEAESGQFTSVWTDSRSTRMSLRQSQGPFDGEEIVLFSKSLDDGSGGARRSRTMTRLEDNGCKIVHRQFNIGADGSERLFMELVLIRKK
jgi:hypothetical protein